MSPCSFIPSSIHLCKCSIVADTSFVLSAKHSHCQNFLPFDSIVCFLSTNTRLFYFRYMLFYFFFGSCLSILVSVAFYSVLLCLLFYGRGPLILVSEMTFTTIDLLDVRNLCNACSCFSLTSYKIWMPFSSTAKNNKIIKFRKILSHNIFLRVINDRLLNKCCRCWFQMCVVITGTPFHIVI